ncbi:MAG TPA: hypothetical protein VFF06_21260, partial [Polyangia bacterium]|nr:hypothetical protein [Polyangia bacterium]
NPPAELGARLRDEADADRRYAAALALARAADTAPEARKILDDAADKAEPASRLTARVARSFTGRPAQMAAFVRILRNGN